MKRFHMLTWALVAAFAWAAMGCCAQAPPTTLEDKMTYLGYAAQVPRHDAFFSWRMPGKKHENLTAAATFVWGGNDFHPEGEEAEGERGFLEALDHLMDLKEGSTLLVYPQEDGMRSALPFFHPFNYSLFFQIAAWKQIHVIHSFRNHRGEWVDYDGHVVSDRELLLKDLGFKLWSAAGNRKDVATAFLQWKPEEVVDLPSWRLGGPVRRFDSHALVLSAHEIAVYAEAGEHPTKWHILDYERRVARAIVHSEKPFSQLGLRATIRSVPFEQALKEIETCDLVGGLIMPPSINLK